MLYNNLKKKLKIYNYFILFLLICILGKLTYIQIIRYDSLYSNALTQWERSFPLQASRGLIYDKNMDILADNVATMSVYAIPSQIINKELTAVQLATVLSCSSDVLLQKFSKTTSMVKIYPEGKGITNKQSKEITKLNLKGIYLIYDNKRFYPYHELLANSIGFVGIDNQGLAGLESQFDSYLKGNEGYLNYIIDAKGNLLNGLDSRIISPQNGFSLKLTIDRHIQQILERELENAYLKYSPDSVYGIIINPNNGDILAISNRPTFNLNSYQQYSQDIYNRNLPIWKSYEPGSTFKVFSFAAGIEENCFDMLKDTYFDKGYEIVDCFTIKSWKKGGHGLQTFLEVLENSSNPGFVEVARRLGKERLYNYILKFGFNEKTNIDMVGESKGIFFKYDHYNNLENATSSFGQGISVTAIQMVRAFSSLINGGILYQPKICDAILSSTNETIFEYPDVIQAENVISKETSQKMRYALESVAAKGSGRKGYIDNYRVGGKTGTAQIAENGNYLQGQYILSYISAFPMDDPQYVTYVCMEKPHSIIQYGGTIIGPIVKNINQDIIQYVKMEPRSSDLEFEYTWMDIKSYPVENYIGKNVKQCTSKYFLIKIIGEGDTVISQLPKENEKIEEGKTIILFT